MTDPTPSTTLAAAAPVALVPHKPPVGVQAIILYKLAKAVFATLVGVLALATLSAGAEALSATFAQVLLDHVARAWALQLATLIVNAGTTAHVQIAAGAAFADGILSAVEGFALRAGHWWAPWLVVIGTSVLLPWEVIEVLKHPHWGRFLVLAVNLGVVAYLLRGVSKEHRKEHPEEYRK